MSDLVKSDGPPVRQDDAGALRVGTSRVLLDLVVEEFEEGATPETIVQQFPTLALSDIYTAIGYYLRHREAIATYLEQRTQSAEKVRRQIEANQGDLGFIRQRLRAQTGR